MAQNDGNDLNRGINSIYSALPLSKLDRCIRILDLDSSVNPGACLSGRLRVVSLKSRPRFAALSYVWGAYSATSDKVVCRGPVPEAETLLPITQNCDAALRRLRSTVRRISIWVDAICINQDDKGEKEGQIPLMEEIYTWAQPVYIWLGPGTSASDRAMDWFLVAARINGPVLRAEYFRGGDEPLGRLRKARIFLDEIRRVLIIRPWTRCVSRVLSKPSEEQLCDLLAREWVERIWTLQEFVLPWDLTILCGQKSISGVDFISCLLAIYLDPIMDLVYSIDNPALRRYLNTWGRLACTWLKHTRPNQWGGDTAGTASVADHIVADARGWHDVRELRKLAEYATIFLLFLLQQIVFLSLLLYIVNRRNFSITFWIGVWVYAPVTVGTLLLLIFWTRRVGQDKPDKPIELITFGKPVRKSRKEISALVGRRLFTFTADALDYYSNLLPAMRERRATHPHDRSFALHGLLRGSGLAFRSPDYAKDASVIFEELFCDLVRWDMTFMKFIVDAGRLPKGVPSWVPDFNASNAWINPEYCNRRFWSGEKPLHTPFRIIDRRLHVGVNHYGFVGPCCNKLRKIELNSHRESVWQNAYMIFQWLIVSLNSLHSTTYRTFLQSVTAAFYAEADSDRSAAPRFRHENPMVVFCQELMDRRYRRNEQGVLSREQRPWWCQSETLEAHTDHIVADLRQGAVLANFIEQCNAMAGRRVLFTMGGGVGTGPESMVEGDTVAIVAGVPVPMVLRFARDRPGISNEQRRREGDGEMTVIGPTLVPHLETYFMRFEGFRYGEDIILI